MRSLVYDDYICASEVLECGLFDVPHADQLILCFVLRVACHRHDHTNISNVLETEVGT
jgi:hypothetical protein